MPRGSISMTLFEIGCFGRLTSSDIVVISIAERIYFYLLMEWRC